MGLFTRTPTIPESTSDYLNNLSGIYSEGFTSATISSVIFPDVISSVIPLSYERAMTIPAVSKAVNLVSGIVSRLEYKDGAPLFLTKTGGFTTPQMRLARTVIDLMMYGHSLWYLERNDQGAIQYAYHVHKSRWQLVNEKIKIDNKVLDETEFVYFESLTGLGLLTTADSSIRQYIAISDTILNRSVTPSPAFIVEQTDNTQADEADVQDLVNNFTEVLRARKGGVVFQPQGLNIRELAPSDSANEMMISARNALRSDLAAFFGLPAGALDASVMAGGSGTYTNTLQERSELLEFSLKNWSEPIANRLNQPDISPNNKVEFDYSNWDSLNSAAGNIGAPLKENPLNNENKEVEDE